jgi:hypothetical protein
MKAIREGYRKQATRALEQGGHFAHVAVSAKDLIALLEDADELEQVRSLVARLPAKAAQG